jgi:hypothetical protein
LDEYKFNKKKRETHLKLFEGQPLREDRKFKTQEIIKNLNTIALSNYSLNKNDVTNEEELKYTDEAMNNRVYSVNFLEKEKIINNIKNFNYLTQNEIKKIEKEDPYIMIECNKILHNNFIKEKQKTNNKYLLKDMFQKKMIKNIENKTKKEIKTISYKQI